MRRKIGEIEKGLEYVDGHVGEKDPEDFHCMNWSDSMQER